MKAKMKRTQVANLLRANSREGYEETDWCGGIAIGSESIRVIREKEIEAIAEKILSLFGVHLSEKEKNGGTGK